MFHQIAEKSYYIFKMRNSGFNHSKSINRHEYNILLRSNKINDSKQYC